MIRLLRSALRYYKLNFRLDLKSLMAYPETFWVALTTIPLWSLLQILFIETIYGQVENFLGYSKYENYVLFGTYKIIQSLAVTIFMVQLDELPDRIRGEDRWSFDMMLLKPIDSQIYATTGRIWFGSLAALSVGMAMVRYGFWHEPHSVSVSGALTYVMTILLATFLFYLIFFFIQTWIFWFEYLQIGETLWFTIQDVGQYPRNLYRGWLGILLNIVFPITLAASVPMDFLFGELPIWRLGMYIIVVGLIALATRRFWQYSIKKYASFSS